MWGEGIRYYLTGQSLVCINQDENCLVHLYSSDVFMLCLFFFSSCISLLLVGYTGGGPTQQEKQTGVLISGLWGELNVSPSCVPPSVPPPINSRWFRANGHSGSPFTPLRFFFSALQNQRENGRLPRWLLFPLLVRHLYTNTPPCHWGRMDITSVQRSPPCFLPVCHILPREAPNPSSGDGGAEMAAQPSHHQARTHTPICFCDLRVLKLGQGWSQTLLWDHSLFHC